MSLKPFVSIVMTSFNRGHYICQAIDSILSQECNFPIEIIIGDDCSTDNSRELLWNYAERFPEVFVLNFQVENQGFGRNWASTVKLARGRYVAFLDDDDYWCDEHRLQEMVDYMEMNDNCGLIYTNRWVYDVEKDKKYKADIFIPENVDKVSYLNSYGFPILFSSAMIRKFIMDKYVCLDDYIRLNMPIQDWPTAMLIAPYCDFHYIDKPSVVYRSYQGSMSNPQEYEQVICKCNKEKVMQVYVQARLGLYFDEHGWDCYVNHLLMNLAYRRRDFIKAKEYSKLIGGKSVKILFSKTWMTFHLFRALKNIKFPNSQTND